MIKKSILLVDDNEEYLEELEDVLYSCGYSVTTVTDSNEALDIARQSLPDVIFLDIKMKNLSGFQLADRLSHSAETSEIKIVGMTGVFTRAGDDQLMKVCGINKCLTKPFSLEDMLNSIEETKDEEQGVTVN